MSFFVVHVVTFCDPILHSICIWYVSMRLSLCVLNISAEEPGCKSDDDCPQSATCLNRQCINPCIVSNPCAPNAECQANNHRAVCHCPSGLNGNPFINCYQGTHHPSVINLVPICIIPSFSKKFWEN